jgi:hypothetical protein
VTVTGTELFETSASWSLQSELSDQSRLGDYQGVASVANTLGIIWMPALYTFLATDLHATGWLIIAAIVVAAAVGIRPFTRIAQQHLEAGWARSSRCRPQPKVRDDPGVANPVAVARAASAGDQRAKDGSRRQQFLGH